jgi:hypothetical protein
MDMYWLRIDIHGQQREFGVRNSVDKASSGLRLLIRVSYLSTELSVMYLP